MARSIALAAYLAWSARGAVRYAERKLAERLDAGKEDAARLDERRGVAARPRPPGPLIWFHAASVGEALALLELARRLLDAVAGLHILVTTGTVASAQVMAARLPDRAVHQFAPLDARPFVAGFLAHWRPDLAVWTESELWPGLIVETRARGVPMLIVNARMSRASYDRWRLLRGMARSLLTRFDYALAQDAATADRLRRLGLSPERMEVAGTLKEGAAALPADETELARMRAGLGGRPVWLAASTHPGEETQVLKAHRRALRTNPRLLLILAPRHASRGGALAEALQADGWAFGRRTAGAAPGVDAQVYLADTMGELGLWYRLAPVSFVGGSLDSIGGHNPFEPAALGSAILHGPHVANFADIYRRLTEAGAARLVSSPETLAEAVGALLSPDRAAEMAHAAWGVVSSGAEAVDRAVEVVLEHLPANGAAT